jgi:hypothetical protein
VIGVAVLPLLTVLAGCAGRAASGGGTAARHERSASLLSRAAAPLPSTSAAPVATAAVCRGRGAGFALSLAISSGGAPNPIAAARRFVRHGGVTGFGTVRSVWRVASTPPVTRDEATVLDGRVSLHAVRLRDRTWAVDEGSRCG